MGGEEWCKRGREWEGEGNGIKKGGGVFILAPTFLFSATLVCLKLSTIPSQIAAKIDWLCRERRHFRVQVEAFGSKWPARGSDGLTGIPFHAFQHLIAEQKNIWSHLTNILYLDAAIRTFRQ